jgi:hypothetical protein
MEEGTNGQSVEKKGMGTGAKVALGCGIGCLVLVVVFAVAAFVAFRMGMSYLDKAAEEFRAKGFENVVRVQNIEVTEPIHEPVLYMGQVVKIMADCTTDLAVMAQVCEIHGTVEGKLHFVGQVLTIQPGAVLKGGLDTKAQLIQNYGQIEGEITGAYQSLVDKSQQSEP